MGFLCRSVTDIVDRFPSDILVVVPFPFEIEKLIEGKKSRNIYLYLQQKIT
jgi:hypothetical protein